MKTLAVVLLFMVSVTGVVGAVRWTRQPLPEIRPVAETGPLHGKKRDGGEEDEEDWREEESLEALSLDLRQVQLDLKWRASAR